MLAKGITNIRRPLRLYRRGQHTYQHTYLCQTYRPCQRAGVYASQGQYREWGRERCQESMQGDAKTYDSA